MIYAVIAAGGVGSRMGNVGKPKQYMLLADKPIIIHTVEKFFVNSEIDKIIILVPRDWLTYTKELVSRYLGAAGDKITVLHGGSTRNETIMNAIDHIDRDDDTLILTHDAVRPFVTARVISENIAAAKLYGATDTVVPATDTIVESVDGETISSIPERKNLYQGQTPQTFKAKKLRELYLGLKEEEKAILTDACKIFSMTGNPVHLVRGEVFNIKITYPYDIRVAKSLLGEETDNEGTVC